MFVLYHSADNPDRWLAAFSAIEPKLQLRVFPEVGNPADIVAAFVFNPPSGLLATLPNLKVILSKGFGVDHLLKDPKLPRHVPVCRLFDPSAVSLMTQYVVHAVIHHHRSAPAFAAAKARGEWIRIPPPDTGETTVGVMGLGILGRDAAETFARLGFKVRGWSRSSKTIPGIECFHGAAGLPTFLSPCKFLVCLLALTPETTDILDRKTFAALPRGAYVVNAARGNHLVDADLLAAIDSGHIAGAALDVFRAEPLPRDHAFWTHPKIVLTPHVAADAITRTAAPLLVDNIRRALDGRPLINQVDSVRGY